MSRVHATVFYTVRLRSERGALSLTRRHRNDRLPGGPRAAAVEPRVEAGPRLEQVLAAGVAQRVQVGHEAEVGKREVRTCGLGLG